MSKTKVNKIVPTVQSLTQEIRKYLMDPSTDLAKISPRDVRLHLESVVYRQDLLHIRCHLISLIDQVLYDLIATPESMSESHKQIAKSMRQWGQSFPQMIDYTPGGLMLVAENNPGSPKNAGSPKKRRLKHIMDDDQETFVSTTLSTTSTNATDVPERKKKKVSCCCLACAITSQVEPYLSVAEVVDFMLQEPKDSNRDCRLRRGTKRRLEFETHSNQTVPEANGTMTKDQVCSTATDGAIVFLDRLGEGLDENQLQDIINTSASSSLWDQAQMKTEDFDTFALNLLGKVPLLMRGSYQEYRF